MVSPGNAAPDDPHSTPEDEGNGILQIDPATLGKHAVAFQAENPRFSDKDPFERLPALDRLRRSLARFARDPSGSDPKYYASPRDLVYYARLKAAADAHEVRGKAIPWPGATEVRHEETTFHWFRSKKKLDPILRDQDDNPIVGYRIGYLNVAQYGTPVLLCNDGRLRMLIKPAGGGAHKGRGKETHEPHDDYAERTFSGYCTLPDPELVYPVLDAGNLYPVSYGHGQSNTLQTEIKDISGLDIPY